MKSPPPIRPTYPVKRSFFPGLFFGLGAYFRVIPTLFRHKLWMVQFLPALLSLTISLGTFFAFLIVAERFSFWIDETVVLPWAELDELVTITSAVLAFLFLAVLFLMVHKYIILVILSPFLGKLAEATYRAEMNDNSTSPLTVRQSIGRGIRINLGNIVREMLINLGFLACSFVPAIGQVLGTVGLFLNQSRFMGYGLMDFPLEHKGLSVKESLRFVRRRTGCSTGVGAGYILLMLIPVIGWMFAPTFGTVAGTLVTIDELEGERNRS